MSEAIISRPSTVVPVADDTSAILRKENRFFISNGEFKRTIIDVSDAKFFAILGCGSCGVEIALLNGDTYNNEEFIYVGTDDCFISEVPKSGKIVVQNASNRYRLYTSNSWSSLDRACGLRLVGNVNIED